MRCAFRPAGPSVLLIVATHGSEERELSGEALLVEVGARLDVNAFWPRDRFKQDADAAFTQCKDAARAVQRACEGRRSIKAHRGKTPAPFSKGDAGKRPPTGTYPASLARWLSGCQFLLRASILFLWNSCNRGHWGRSWGQDANSVNCSGLATQNKSAVISSAARQYDAW